MIPKVLTINVLSYIDVEEKMIAMFLNISMILTLIAIILVALVLKYRNKLRIHRRKPAINSFRVRPANQIAPLPTTISLSISAFCDPPPDARPMSVTRIERTEVHSNSESNETQQNITDSRIKLFEVDETKT